MLVSADTLTVLVDFKRFYPTILYTTSEQCSPKLATTQRLWPACPPKAVSRRYKCKNMMSAALCPPWSIGQLKIKNRARAISYTSYKRTVVHE